MNEKISVIVPVFNSQVFIERCLSSICENTYKNLEIIVIDDGSSDASGKICDFFATQDARIRVVHQENAGVSKSRNRGLNIATGDYIAFIDSDDCIDNTYFQDLLYMMCDGEYDLAICSIAHIRSGVISYSTLENMDVDLHLPVVKDKLAFYELNKKNFLYGPVNKLYKRNLIIHSKVMFPEDTSYGEDLLFNFAYLQCCRKIIFKKKPIYYYNHDNETSLSHKYRDNLFENGLRLNSAMKNFAIDKGLMTKELAAYYSLRVFDDAYNSLFDVWSTRCTLNICAKLRRTREIMNHIDVQEVVKFIELGSYSKLYVRIIKYRLAILFAGIRLIARCFRNNGGE